MRIKSESDIIIALADDVTNAIKDQVILALEGNHDTTSGDDSGLSNVWEEICVQVQGEHSSSWQAYDDTVRAYVHEALSQRPVYQQIAVWLQTPEGIDEEDEGRDSDEEIAYDTDAAANSIVSAIYGAASDYSNEAVKAYLAS